MLEGEFLLDNCKRCQPWVLTVTSRRKNANKGTHLFVGTLTAYRGGAAHQEISSAPAHLVNAAVGYTAV
jgi:hypothetical protein